MADGQPYPGRLGQELEVDVGAAQVEGRGRVAQADPQPAAVVAEIEIGQCEAHPAVVVDLEEQPGEQLATLDQERRARRGDGCTPCETVLVSVTSNGCSPGSSQPAMPKLSPSPQPTQTRKGSQTARGNTGAVYKETRPRPARLAR